MPASLSSRSTRALACLALALSATAITPGRSTAQDIIDAKHASVIRASYLADMDTVHVKIMALANAIPEDKYSWRPSAGVRSVSEVLMHIVTEWYFYGPRSLGGNPPADFGPPRETLPKMEKITAKSEVLAQLNKSWDYCKAQLNAADPATLTGKVKPWNQPLLENVLGMTGDQHEHLGQLIAYARSVGVKPPWSK